MVKRTAVPKEFQTAAVDETASEPQLNYLRALRSGKDLSKLSAEQQAWLEDADFDTFPSLLPKKRMSVVIEQLKELDWMKGDKLAEEYGVADGRYAVEKPDGTLMFYSVKKGSNWTNVSVWASDARWLIRDMKEKRRILKAIKNDPDAGPRFGREIGRCYVCGRTLTDAKSRQLGIGPICRGFD